MAILPRDGEGMMDASKTPTEVLDAGATIVNAAAQLTREGRPRGKMVMEAIGVYDSYRQQLTRERNEARRAAAESARRGGECAKDRSVLAEQLVEARAECERLRGFALAVIRAEFENPSEEGERIMAAAEDAGLVMTMIHVTDQDAAACEVCREWSSGVAGDWHYELVKAYK